MQPQLNASKASQAIPAGSLKKCHLKSIQKQIKSTNRSWRAKNWLFSETKKVKQLHSEIPKLKTNSYHQSQPKEN